MVEVQPVKTFSPVEELAQLRSNMEVPVDKFKHLQADQASSGNLDTYFNCNICLMVVEEPRECSDCDQLCCVACLEIWQQTKNQCPNCRKDANLEKHVNRFVMQQLNQTEFNCDKCEAKFTYKSRKEHWVKCGIDLNCPSQDCPRENIPFATSEELRQHWTDECNFVKVKCSFCRVEVLKAYITEHNCELGLLALVEKLEARVQELELECAVQKAQGGMPIPAIEEEIKEIDPFFTNKRCLEDHAMIYKNEIFPRCVDGEWKIDENLICGLCGQSIDIYQGYFRCTLQECEYQICKNCAHLNP